MPLHLGVFRIISVNGGLLPCGALGTAALTEHAKILPSHSRVIARFCELGGVCMTPHRPPKNWTPYGAIIMLHCTRFDGNVKKRSPEGIAI
jgi:hypothetical protein